MADLLIEESERQKKVSKGKRKTPFVKEALPGEAQTFRSSTYFLGFCQFCAIFFICLHTFVYAVTYDLWGHGNYGMIFISSIQLSCAIYTFFLAYVTTSGWMKTVYSVHIVVYIAMALVILPTYLFSVLAYIAYEQADHIASYTVTRNSIDFCSATIFPFTGLAVLLVTLVDHRSFEIDA